MGCAYTLLLIEMNKNQMKLKINCKVKPLKNILETARDLGATEFVKYVEESGLQKEWVRDGAFTLFAPTNEAFKSMSRSLRQRLENIRGDIENPILRYHITDTKLVSDAFQPDMTIPTLFEGNRLRINKYSSGVRFLSHSTYKIP